MPKYRIDVPGKGSFEVESPTELTDEQAYLAVQQQIANTPPPKEGFIADIEKGAKSAYQGAKTGISALFGDKNAAAQRGLEEQKRLEEEYKQQVDLGKIKEAYQDPEGGLLSAAGETARQVPHAIVEGLPMMGQMALGAKAGAKAGSMFGAKGRLIGAAAGSIGSIIPQMAGQGLTRQAAEQQATGEPTDVSVGKAYAAAVPQAALMEVTRFLPLGKSAVAKALGISDDVLAKRSAAEIEALANESFAKAAARGTLEGLAVNVPGSAGMSMLDRWQAGLPLTSEDALLEYGQSMATGAMIAPMGVVGGLGKRSAAREGVAAREYGKSLEEQQRQLQEQQAEEQRKQSPEYALETQQRYLDAEKAFRDLQAQVIKVDKNSPTYAADIEHNKGISAQLKELGKQRQELAAEYNSVKRFIPEDQLFKAPVEAPPVAPEKPLKPTVDKETGQMGIPMPKQEPTIPRDIFGREMPKPGDVETTVKAPEGVPSPLEAAEQIRKLEAQLDVLNNTSAGSPERSIQINSQKNQIYTALKELRKVAPQVTREQIADVYDKWKKADAENAHDVAARHAKKLQELETQYRDQGGEEAPRQVVGQEDMFDVPAAPARETNEQTRAAQESAQRLAEQQRQRTQQLEEEEQGYVKYSAEDAERAAQEMADAREQAEAARAKVEEEKQAMERMRAAGTPVTDTLRLANYEQAKRDMALHNRRMELLQQIDDAQNPQRSLLTLLGAQPREVAAQVKRVKEQLAEVEAKLGMTPEYGADRDALRSKLITEINDHKKLKPAEEGEALDTWQRIMDTKQQELAGVEQRIATGRKRVTQGETGDTIIAEGTDRNIEEALDRLLPKAVRTPSQAFREMNKRHQQKEIIETLREDSIGTLIDLDYLHRVPESERSKQQNYGINHLEGVFRNEVVRHINAKRQYDGGQPLHEEALAAVHEQIDQILGDVRRMGLRNAKPEIVQGTAVETRPKAGAPTVRDIANQQRIFHKLRIEKLNLEEDMRTMPDAQLPAARKRMTQIEGHLGRLQDNIVAHLTGVDKENIAVPAAVEGSNLPAEMRGLGNKQAASAVLIDQADQLMERYSKVIPEEGTSRRRVQTQYNEGLPIVRQQKMLARLTDIEERINDINGEIQRFGNTKDPAKKERREALKAEREELRKEVETIERAYRGLQEGETYTRPEAPAADVEGAYRKVEAARKAANDFKRDKIDKLQDEADALEAALRKSGHYTDDAAVRALIEKHGDQRGRQLVGLRNRISNLKREHAKLEQKAAEAAHNWREEQRKQGIVEGEAEQVPQEGQKQFGFMNLRNERVAVPAEDLQAARNKVVDTQNEIERLRKAQGRQDALTADEITQAKTDSADLATQLDAVQKSLEAEKAAHAHNSRLFADVKEGKQMRLRMGKLQERVDVARANGREPRVQDLAEIAQLKADLPKVAQQDRTNAETLKASREKIDNLTAFEKELQQKLGAAKERVARAKDPENTVEGLQKALDKARDTNERAKTKLAELERRQREYQQQEDVRSGIPSEELAAQRLKEGEAGYVNVHGKRLTAPKKLSSWGITKESKVEEAKPSEAAKAQAEIVRATKLAEQAAKEKTEVNKAAQPLIAAEEEVKKLQTAVQHVSDKLFGPVYGPENMRLVHDELQQQVDLLRGVGFEEALRARINKTEAPDFEAMLKEDTPAARMQIVEKLQKALDDASAAFKKAERDWAVYENGPDNAARVEADRAYGAANIRLAEARRDMLMFHDYVERDLHDAYRRLVGQLEAKTAALPDTSAARKAMEKANTTHQRALEKLNTATSERNAAISKAAGERALQAERERAEANQRREANAPAEDRQLGLGLEGTRVTRDTMDPLIQAADNHIKRQMGTAEADLRRAEAANDTAGQNAARKRMAQLDKERAQLFEHAPRKVEEVGREEGPENPYAEQPAPLEGVKLPAKRDAQTMRKLSGSKGAFESGAVKLTSEHMDQRTANAVSLATTAKKLEAAEKGSKRADTLQAQYDRLTEGLSAEEIKTLKRDGERMMGSGPTMEIIKAKERERAARIEQANAEHMLDEAKTPAEKELAQDDLNEANERVAAAERGVEKAINDHETQVAKKVKAQKAEKAEPEVEDVRSSRASRAIEDVYNEDSDYASQVRTDENSKKLDENTAHHVLAGDIGRALDSLAKNGSTPEVRALAAKLKPFLGNTKIGVKKGLKGADGKEIAGLYRHGEDRIDMNPLWMTEEDTLHEMVHAATLQVLKTPARLRTAEQNAAVKQLEGMMTQMLRNPEFRGEYATKNMAEFISEVYSNKFLRDKMDSIGKPQSLWQRFKGFVKRLFGFDDGTPESRKAMDAIDKIMSESGTSMAGERVASATRMYHGSPKGDIADFKGIVHLTPSKEAASKFAKREVAFTAKTEGASPKVYSVNIDTRDLLDLRTPEGKAAYMRMRAEFNKTADPDARLPSVTSEGFIQSGTGAPGFGHVNEILRNMPEYKGMWVDDGAIHGGLTAAVRGDAVNAGLVKDTYASPVRYASKDLEEAGRIADKFVARHKSWTDKVRENASGLAFETQAVDRFAPLERLSKMMEPLKGMQMMSYLRMYDQRMHFVAQSVANGVIQNVAKKRADGRTEYVLESVKGANLKDIAQILSKSGAGSADAANRLFTLYLAANRAKRHGLDSLNLDGTITQADLDKAVATIKSKPELEANFKLAQAKYNEYNRNLVGLLESTGAITKELADTLRKHDDYIPFYREKGGTAQLIIGGEHPISIGSIAEQPYLHELIGGNRPILDFLTSSVQNTNILTDMALRNLSTKNAVMEMVDMGLAKISNSKTLTGPEVVKFRIDGAEKSAIIDTDKVGIPAALLVKGMEGIPTQMPALLRAMSVPSRILRKAVTLSPLYAAKQVFRDSLAAPITSGADFTPVMGALRQIGSAQKHVLENRGVTGGQQFTGAPEDLSLILRQITSGKGNMAELIGKAESMGMEADALTRRAQYEAYRKQGLSEMEATLMSLESMNFSKRGASPSMHMVNSLIPFFNAQVQSLNVLYKAATGNMPFNERLKIQEKLYTRGMMLAGVSMAYAIAMQDDEAYKNATPDQRANNWFVRIPGVKEPLRIPVPFEIGYIFKALPEAVLNMANGKHGTEDAQETIKFIAKQMIPGGSSWGLPQALKPAVEVGLNRSTFTGRDIVSAHEQKLLPEHQYRDNTSEIAKMLGGAAGISPIKIDALVNGYTGAMGLAFMQAAGMGFAKPNPNATEKNMSELPIIGGAFQKNDAGAIANDMYKHMQRAEQVKATFDDLVAKGKKAEAQALLQDPENKIDFALQPIAQKYVADMAKFRKMQNDVKASPNMTPAQKRDKLQEIQKAMTEYSKAAREGVDKAKVRAGLEQ